MAKMISITASPSTLPLGDRQVNRVGFGLKRLAGSTSSDRPTEQAIALLRQVVELGVNHLDTASFYPSLATDVRKFDDLGWANVALREALAPYPDDLVIATKVGPTPHGFARADRLRALVETDLRDLGEETLDLVYLRQTGLEDVSEHFGVLAELRSQGLIRHLGLSNIRVEHLRQAQRIAPVVAVQNRYGVDFGRVNDELLTLCGEEGIAFVPFFSLAGADRELGGVATSDPVLEVARNRGMTPAQIRIAWTLHQGPHVLAIPGTSSPDHLTDNLAAGAIQLTPDELALLATAPVVS
jgi:pyridoxine 4-dehydrogenase